MNWQEILALWVPFFAFMGWIYNHQIDKKMDDLKDEIKEMKKEISSVKDRLTRLEGRFDEREYWESCEDGKTEIEDKIIPLPSYSSNSSAPP